MSLTFIQSLETSRVLQERLASTPAGEKRAALEQATTQTDFATFGMFKAALSIGPALSAAARSPLGKGLQWGTGLGIPAVGAAHLISREAEKTVDHARNQALLTALGVGGMGAISNALGGDASPTAAPPAAAPPVEQPQTMEQAMARPGLGVRELASLRGFPTGDNDFRPEPEGYAGLKMSSDATLQKLAAVVLLDNVLEQQVEKLAGAEQADAVECLFLNRNQGTSLLRELF